MSSQNEKKSWTFVPERSRAPENKRATRRKTTLRAFTFVQDWDPRISPIPPTINNNASQKKASHKKYKNKPVSSQSSESSIRESPIAQLVRSSPGPIIVARRVPGSRNKSFKSPHLLSPSTSISSQSSLSSRQKSSRSPAGGVPSFYGETGVSPAFSVPRTRGRQQSSSKKRSPVSQGEEEAIDTSPGAENIANSSDVSTAANAARLQESVISSGESSGRVQSRSSTAKKNKRHLVLGNHTETPDNVSKSQSPSSETSTTSTRSRKRRGPSLTFPKKSTKGRTSLSFNAEDKNKSVNVLDIIDENFSSDDGRREQSHISPASDDPRQATWTIHRTTQGSNSTSRKGSATGKTRQASDKDDSDSTNVPVESDVPTPGSVGVPQRPSTSSDRSRSTTGSRKKRGPSLTFKKKSVKRRIGSPQDAALSAEQYPSSSSSSSSQTSSRRKLSSKSSGSDGRSPESVARRKSPSPKGQKPGGSSARSSKGKLSSRSSGSDSSGPEANTKRRKSPSHEVERSGGSRAVTPKGKPVSKKILTSKMRAKQLAKTPDRSMSFITTTPKSGHVVRRQPRTQDPRSGPVKATGPAGQRKRGVGTESSEPEEPVEKRAKVRLYTTGARPRLVGDTTDMDILLNCLEDTAMEFRDALDAPRRKKAVTKFMDQARHELTEMISMQHDFRLQTLSLSRTNSSIRRYRQELLNLQRENTSLDVRIAENKKKQEKSQDNRAKTLKGIDSFVSDLQKLHQTYVSKYPKDIKSVEPVAQDNAETVSSDLKPTLELQNTTASLSNKLRQWLGSQLLQK